MNRWLTVLLLSATLTVSAGEPLPIDPLWQSAEFRKAFTASYGVDARIEPRLTTAEKAVLDSVATEMEDSDREGAIAKLTGSSLLGESPALIFSLGNLRFEEGKVEDAVENFQKAVTLYPNFRDAHRNLSVALVQAEEYAKAEPHLRRAVELGAADGVTFGMLGYCHAVAGRHQASLQAYRRAQLTMPEETQWQVGEADALTSLGDHGAAESLFTGLLQQRPSEAGLWLRQADVWIRSGQQDRAIANLEFVRRMGALAAKDVALLGHLFLDVGMESRAVDCYREAHQIALEKEDQAAAVLEVAKGIEMLSRHRFFAEARELHESVFSGETPALEGEMQTIQLRIGAMIELQDVDGDAEQGLAKMHQLLEQNPLDGEALLILAAYHQRQEARDEAMMLLEQAAKIDEKRAEALMLHGRLLIEDREYAAGLDLIEESLALAPRAGMEDYLKVLRKLAKAAD